MDKNLIIEKLLLKDIRIFAYLSSNKNFKIFNHIDEILTKVNNVFNGKIRNLLIEMPPRHGKTESVIYSMAYYLKKFENKSVIYCTYSADLSHDKSRRVRDIINSTSGAKVKKDLSAMKRFETENNNILFSVGVFGSITGRGANLLVIDDIIKNQEQAKNERYMNKVFDYYKYVLRTRLMPNDSHVIIINTRWSKNDFSNFIRENYNDFEILSLPAINLNNEPLCEHLFNLEELNKIKKDIGIEAFMSLYQQQPIDEINKFYDSKDFRYFKIENNNLITDDDYIVNLDTCLKFFVIDTATTKTRSSDYFVLLYIAIDRFNNVFILDCYREKVEFTDHEKIIISYFYKYQPHFVLIEKFFVGIALFQILKQKGLPVKTIESRENKILRAEHSKIYYQNNKIYHNKNMKNLIDFEEELINFPNSKHDDIVDCISYACIFAKQRNITSSFSIGKIT